MALTIPNAPFTVNCQSYVDLRATPTNLKLGWSATATKSRPPRIFAVRACNGAGHLTDADCEASFVAGNVPAAPPVPPKAAAPIGTPVVPSLPLQRRPRRNRKSPALR